MRILDKYTVKPLLFTFFGCLAVFIFLYVISDILSHLDEILKNKVGIRLLYQYYLTYLPIIFTQTSPIAILLSTIYTFGKFNQDNELIAMRASGLSLWRISAPLLAIGALLCVTIFYTNERHVPKAQIDAERLKSKIEGNGHSSPKDDTIENMNFYGLGNRLFFVNLFDAKHNYMEGITILEQDEQQNLTAKIIAKSASYNGTLWIFHEFSRFNFDKKGHVSGDAMYEPEQMMGITETPQDFLQQRKRPEFMNIVELEDYIWKLQKSGATSVIRNLLVDLYQRYAGSFSGIILILIGIPFSFVIRKRANIFSSFGICIAISFLYYVLSAVGIALGKSGIMFPSLSVWLTPVGFSLVAINKISKAS